MPGATVRGFLAFARLVRALGEPASTGVKRGEDGLPLEVHFWWERNNEDVCDDCNPDVLVCLEFGRGGTLIVYLIIEDTDLFDTLVGYCVREGIEWRDEFPEPSEEEVAAMRKHMATAKAAGAAPATPARH